ncbi:MAG: CDP-diacylglycerol--glycerol-3-phosphate 3-phosphatidyltransferase [Candidatus Marinimicrobia bacterium]|nr:CDP-diacylglycerol--glycerol-3-phosphate 3-phosphatidyltransferase [Candidatus Neomarinimicrobiota bacterium]|tara:strand:- start:1294 stop:1824 length:531 start_codon:yes stop_codon:yes gene_type:complete
MTLASYISVLRIILIIPTIYSLELNLTYLALILFLIAGLTDYLDGYVARKTNTETSLGALLDLLADKLLVCLILIWCAFLLNSFLIILPCLIIVSRELAISSMRQFLVEKTGKNPVEVTYIAKSKTTIQIIAICFLILCPEMGSLFNQLSIVLIWTASLVSIYSLYNYLISYKHYF